ncbi:hypothetical protein FFK22_034105 [Mycobacterium sp. KBS0706]|uniref:hypothetical protein n=1 Tax=Mycobacterium sp. KBS0706 TaxID=2578109 RepID=UPI00110F7A84|nr:hypothetical protein [Mycobacterium sp. KBS0706]TSD84154.1 hypothetical protein FFK22_034105 [Mycobacterium sp. KBS0706]
MNIYEQRSEITRLFHRELETSYIVVSGPDHPLLIEGPDVLVGGEGGMLAIFMPKAKERARPDQLEVRFILSRLALPPDVRHVMILNEAPYSRAIELLGRNFAIVLRWDSRRDLAKIARDKQFVGKQRLLPPEVTGFARHRFADALQVTRVLQWINRSYERERVHDDSRQRRPGKTPFKHVGPGLLFTSFGWGAPNGTAIRSLTDRTTLAGFALDNGVPYPTREDDYGLAVVNQLPEHRGDPDKLIRAAAFAGWSFIPEEQQHRVDAVANRLQERRNSRPVG